MTRDLVVFAEDWGYHPASTEHLVRRLAATRKVVWMNSLGLRRPRLSLKDAKRAAGKLGQIFSRAQSSSSDHTLTRNSVPDSMDIVAPHAIPAPGTLRDSLVLLAVVLEQQTELKPTQIITDTGAYSDVVFGLFRLLGYRFSPRLADIGGTRFWRIDPKADYGELNDISRHRLSLRRIAPHWDDMLRLAGSLQLGRGPATGIMRTLQVGDRRR